MNRKLVVGYISRETSSLLFMGVALFWSAGTIFWWPAWGALVVMLGWIGATVIVISRYHPDLLAERLGFHKGAKSWDMAILGALALTQLVRYILAGLDYRFHWSGGISVPVQIAALVVCLLSYGLFVWATATNAYFSHIVRIQSDRSQAVVSTGPYHIVRHPAYLGALVYEVAVAFLLGSWWALIPGLVNLALFILRTAKEDRLLSAELPGYQDFACRVRYRLFPGVW
jgi:protein-S-isoprenylcysteine O-methyltransferase Ste14